MDDGRGSPGSSALLSSIAAATAAASSSSAAGSNLSNSGHGIDASIRSHASNSSAGGGDNRSGVSRSPR